MTPNAHIRQIIGMVAEHHRLPVELILSRRRHCRVDAARKDAIKAVHLANPHLSTPQLGTIFDRHYSTILHALGGRRIVEGHPEHFRGWPE